MANHSPTNHNQMEVIVTKSNKGGDKLFVGNFGYHFRSINTDKEYRWVCANRKSYGCSSSVVTRKCDEHHQVVRGPFEHNHPRLENERVLRKPRKSKNVTSQEKSDSKKRKLSTELGPHGAGHAVKVKMEFDEERDMSVWFDSSELKHNLHLGLDPKEDNKATTHNDIVNCESQKVYYNRNANGVTSPKRKPIVRSDMEADGTVNIRIFLEESLLSSFVINAHHTSNVNIRISKDDIQRNS